MYRAIISLSLALLCGNVFAQKDSEFPGNRPKHARLYCDTGILQWRSGNKWLTTSITLSNGEKRFYFRVSPDLINGKYCDCDIPPSAGEERDSTMCKDWPPNLVIGKTRVKVIYWWGHVQGHRDRISDEIIILKDE